MNVHAEVQYVRIHYGFHVSGVRENQCIPIDVVLPSTREVNGRGGGEEWDEWRVRNGCDANGTRGQKNQFSLLKQMRTAQPCNDGSSFFPLPSFPLGRPHCYSN